MLVHTVGRRDRGALPLLRDAADHRPLPRLAPARARRRLRRRRTTPASRCSSRRQVYGDTHGIVDVLERTGVHASFVVAEIVALLASFRLAQAQAATLDLRAAASGPPERRARRAQRRARRHRPAPRQRRRRARAQLAADVHAEAGAVAETGSDVLAGVAGIEDAAERSAAAADRRRRRRLHHRRAGRGAPPMRPARSSTAPPPRRAPASGGRAAVASAVVGDRGRRGACRRDLRACRLAVRAHPRDLGHRRLRARARRPVQPARPQRLDRGRTRRRARPRLRRRRRARSASSPSARAPRRRTSTACCARSTRPPRPPSPPPLTAPRSPARGRDAVGEADGALEDAGRAGVAVEDSARRIERSVASTGDGAQRIGAALGDAREAIDLVVIAAGDGRASAERLRDLSETLRTVTSRLEGVALEDEAVPAYS